jgi:hypothetical protein
VSPNTRNATEYTTEEWRSYNDAMALWSPERIADTNAKSGDTVLASALDTHLFLSEYVEAALAGLRDPYVSVVIGRREPTANR